MAKVRIIENTSALQGSDMNHSMEQQKKKNQICKAAACCSATAPHERNQTFMFSVFPIYAVTAAASALHPYCKCGITATGCTHFFCVCWCVVMKVCGMLQDWLYSPGHLPSEIEAGRIPDHTACTVQGVLQLLQTLYAIMEQSTPSSYRNGQSALLACLCAC